MTVSIWTRNPARDTCGHNSLTIAETGDSVIGPDPLFSLACECGFRTLQVGAYEHSTPDSPMGRARRARFARKGTGYFNA